MDILCVWMCCEWVCAAIHRPNKFISSHTRAKRYSWHRDKKTHRIIIIYQLLHTDTHGYGHVFSKPEGKKISFLSSWSSSSSISLAFPCFLQNPLLECHTIWLCVNECVFISGSACVRPLVCVLLRNLYPFHYCYVVKLNPKIFYVWGLPKCVCVRVILWRFQCSV